MNNCPSCHKLIIPDVPGRAPMSYKPWGDDSEVIILCQTCAEELLASLQKKRSEKAQQKVVWEFLKKVSAAILVLLFIFACAKAAFGAEKEPSMSCSKVHVQGIIRCYANDTNGFDVEWYTIAYGRIEYSDFGLQVELPVHAKYFTLIVMNLTKGNDQLQSGVWARAKPDGSVEYKKHEKGMDPNKDIPEPQNFKRACIVSILGIEGRVFYEPVLIVGETADDYWCLKEGYDKPVNVPKEKVLLAGEHRLMTAADGQRRPCKCPA